VSYNAFGSHRRQPKHLPHRTETNRNENNRSATILAVLPNIASVNVINNLGGQKYQVSLENLSDFLRVLNSCGIECVLNGFF
jgi:hypothetical protein